MNPFLALAVALGSSAAILTLFLLIRHWVQNPDDRPCLFFGHSRRWLALKTRDLKQDWNCNDHWHNNISSSHLAYVRVYIGRWVCRRCPTLGETCLGGGQDWKIEHEELVPDTKKWANWSEDRKETK